MRQWWWAILAVACVAAVSAGLLVPVPKEEAAPSEARLYLNWILTSSFAGDVLAADRYAAKNKLRLDLEVGGEGRDPIKLVGDGDFGVDSADEVIRAVDKGAPIAIIGVLADQSPAAFVALKSSGIKTPKDFEGRRVGILPFGATGLVYQALLARTGVDRSRINEVVVTGDLRPFVNGSVDDVQPVFLYDEPVSLEREGVAFNVIDPRQYGVNFKGQCYFTTRNTIASQPDLVRRFLASVIGGWLAAKSDPAAAVAAIKARSPVLDAQEELIRLRRALPFFVPRDETRILETNPQSWEGMLGTLVTSGTISHRVPPSAFLDLSLLPNARQAQQS